MATFLYRLGRWAFRRRWYVVLVWAVVLGGAGLASTTAPGLPDDTASMPGIEAQAALDLMRERFPDSMADIDTAVARVVFVAPAGQRVTEPHNQAAIERLVGDVRESGQIATVTSPFETKAVSQDGSAAYATARYTSKIGDVTEATKDSLRHAVDRARAAGLTVEVGGPVLASKPKVGGVSEVLGVAFAALVLLVTFGSLVAAGLPLVTAVLGVGVSMFTILAVGNVLGLSTASGTLASMLGLAVGIDYALFVLSRYREERAAGHPAQEAAGLAVGTAGSAVVFAGLTVIVALAGLVTVGIPTAAEMGLTAAGAVATAVLVALTLVPALLSFCPDIVLTRRTTGATDNAGARWARFVLRRPGLVVLTSVAALAISALPVVHLRLGMPGDEARPTETTERRAYDALASAFGPGFNGPLTIVVDARGAGNPSEAVLDIATKIADTEGMVKVSPPQFNSAHDTALFTAVPASAPTDARTKDLVQRIRAERSAIETGVGAPFLVSGTTAVNIDVAQKVQTALIPYFTLVLGLAFLLLLVVFRSLLVPLKAVLGFLLSVLAALGAVVAVFQWGWGAEAIGLQQSGPILSMMPIVLVGMIFGLAMDYEVFLVTRIREARTHGEPAGQAVVTGFRHSVRVVVAAALIMIAVFAGFIGAELALIKMIGFGLAVAVLVDAFVVRMALVPAVLGLLGERAWALPRWLYRLLPHVDVEGEALRRDAALEPVVSDAGNS
ncbi:RND superfamily putative drug exporter [Nocardia tenerifensis]|uniref:RND superfamily putative drug exporter n=1 Tax=Nocardia tenerifensis TaxID=228006 RepID=A0A318JQY9_9NOCA|nr:MMPL family transporter [Nocardia tenerifensis]PXX58094.1 RND superfamily putative drug exporter [Nocardia tenerifensis]